MKRFIQQILSKLFGYKYFVVVYEVKKENYITKGNMNVRFSRLNKIDIEYIRKEISNRQDCKIEDVLIFNIIRV